MLAGGMRAWSIGGGVLLPRAWGCCLFSLLASWNMRGRLVAAGESHVVEGEKVLGDAM